MTGSPLPFDPELLLRESAWVAALARSLTRDASAADDVVQDTWLAALVRPPGSREPGQVRAFLSTIVRRMASAHGRAEASRALRERRGARPEAVAPAGDALDRLAVQRELAQALLDLREPYRTVVALRYVDGLAPREIAERLERSPEAVRTQISRGLEMLRERLDREHAGDRGAWCLVLGKLARGEAGPAAVASATLGGWIVLTKIALAAAAALVLAVGWWRWRFAEEALTRPDVSALAAEAPPAQEVAATGRTELPGEARSTVPVRAEAKAAEAGKLHIRGQVVSEFDRRGLPEASVELRAPPTDVKQRQALELKQAELAQRAGKLPPEKLAALEGGALAKLAASTVVAARVSCDAEGWFELDATPGNGLTLVANARGHVARSASASKLAPGANVVLALAPAGALDVEVVDTAGNPVSGVWLALQASGDANVHLLEPPRDPRGHGPSDSAGRARIEVVPAGVELSVAPLLLGVSGSSKLPSAKPVLATVDPAALRGSVRIVLPTAGALIGIVFPPAAESERIEASFTPALAPGQPAVASVGANGVFLFERLPAGQGSLELTTVRLGSRASRSIGEKLPALVVAGETTDLGRLELPRPARLAGSVTDWRGASSNDFLDVRFLRAGRLLASTSIDGDGKFEAWLSPGPCTIELVYAKRLLGAYPAEAPDESCELDPFAFSAGLRGRTPEGCEDLKLLFPLLVPGDPSDDGWVVSPKPTLGAAQLHDGAFRLLFLEPGRYSLLAGFGEQGTAWIRGLQLERGRELDLGRLRCGFGAVEGRVTGTGGAAAAGAEVVLESPFAGVVNLCAQQRATAGADGRFRFDRLAAGPWRARARWNGAAGESELLDVASGSVLHTEVELLGAASLSVHVQERGEPCRQGSVTLERLRGPAQGFERKLDLAGTCEFTELAPGPWRWTLSTPRTQRAGTLTLAAGEERQLQIDVEREALRFRLVGDDAALIVSEATAWSLDAPDAGMARASRGGPGTFELDLEPGRYLFAIRGALEGAAGVQQRTAVASVVRQEGEVELAASSAALELRADGAQRNHSAPAATLIAVDGVRLTGRPIALPVVATAEGWRCESVPPGALVRLRGAPDVGGAVEREVAVPAHGGVELDWR